MSAFFLVVSGVWLLAHLYMSRRLVDASALADRRFTKWLGRAAFAVLALLPLITLTLRRSSAPADDAFALIAFTSMGFSTLLIAFVVAFDLARVIYLSGRRAYRAVAGQPSRGATAVSAEPVADPERRRFMTDLGRAGLVGSAGTMTAVGFVHATRVPHIERVEVPVEDLPEDLDGYTIAQLTDIHIGPTIHGQWLRQVVAAVNELEPDLVAVTGDVVDGFVETLQSEVAPLGELRGRDGVYYVTGNHEYYWDGKAWSEHFGRLGLEVLTNTHRMIRRGAAKLVVGGVTDIRGGGRVRGHKSDPRLALAGSADADFKLLLAHQPRSVFEAAKAGWDLQISGHTHGGQYAPFSFMIGLFQPFTHGLDRHLDTQIYVSRGTGYWGPPNRLGSDSEITLLTLRRV